MAEEGEEAQGVQGLLSPGRKVSETPTAVKAMEGGGCFWTVVVLLASNGTCCA